LITGKRRICISFPNYRIRKRSWRSIGESLIFIRESPGSGKKSCWGIASRLCSVEKLRLGLGHHGPKRYDPDILSINYMTCRELARSRVIVLMVNGFIVSV